VVEKYRPQLTEYAKICHDIKEPVGAVTVAWQLANAAISSVIIGPCTPEDLSELIHAADINQDQETMGRSDKIYPGPGGAAPWAYEGWGELNKH
jgi:aryl-alcohol dehydrogenase-like predicted oxidoreductase